MRYAEAIAWAYSLQPRGIRLELDRMRDALALAGDPQRGLRVVHVAGTNGKGSTSAMIERGLRAAGLRTGLYTSPHLHVFGERIRVAGRALGRPEVARRLTAARALLSRAGAPQLTFFEVATLVALQTFADRKCDVVVLEVGLGGRFDATNVVEAPLVTAITSIAMDHEQYLGTTLEAIAGEKAGIVKRGVPLVVAALDPRALGVIGRVAHDVAAPLTRATIGPSDVRARGRPSFVVSASGRRVSRLRPALAGAHQLGNVAVAASVLLLLRDARLRVSDAAIRTGVEDVRWPGRLERIRRHGRADVLLDAAHNPEGAEALAAHLRTLPRSAPRVLCFGAMKDKAWPKMLEALAPEVDRAIFVAPPLGRAEDPTVLASRAGERLRAHVARDPRSALRAASSAAGERGLVVVCGSIFVLAPIRAALLGIDADPPIAM